jgi:hypothetical protein
MSPKIDISRRAVLAAGARLALAGAAGAVSGFARAAEEPLLTRPMPHSGERLPVVGIGTAVLQR